ncbi:MAG: efflux RND transporter periplasmic adaptor subunit [Saprospirales bacterium]|nr:efflux RND transporter periplasmic adaptor subunit [Saprospirales bacterium]
MKKNTFLLLLVALLGNDACKHTAEPSGAVARPARSSYDIVAVEGFRVKPSVLVASVTASGTLLPMEETELHPETSGRVVSINLPEGKMVQKGALLVKIFDQDLQTQLRKLDTQLKQAEITEQRLGDLLQVKGVSQQEYDLAALQVQTLRSEMELVRISIDKTELRAPYAGMIGLRKISPGAYVTPSTAVATIRSAGALKIDFSIPEKYSNLIRIGQTVRFTVEGGRHTYTALVQATEQSISADTRNLQVRAVVRGNAAELLPGTFAEVNLSLGNKTQALLIPTQAVIPQARDKKVFVSRKGKAASVTVKTGVRQSGMVEITDGLTIGDTIAITGILFLRPDTPIQFSKVE